MKNLYEKLRPLSSADYYYGTPLSDGSDPLIGEFSIDGVPITILVTGSEDHPNENEIQVIAGEGSKESVFLYIEDDFTDNPKGAISTANSLMTDPNLPRLLYWTHGFRLLSGSNHRDIFDQTFTNHFSLIYNIAVAEHRRNDYTVYIIFHDQTNSLVSVMGYDYPMSYDDAVSFAEELDALSWTELIKAIKLGSENDWTALFDSTFRFTSKY